MQCCEIGSCNCNVNIETPKHMNDYKLIKNTISIDKCIVDEIKFLHSKGIMTFGSCCGHGVKKSMVNVSKDDIPTMLDMGYKFWDNIPYGCCQETFELKFKKGEGLDAI